MIATNKNTSDYHMQYKLKLPLFGVNKFNKFLGDML